MSFENAMVAMIAQKSFGSAKVNLAYKERAHISKLRLDRFGESIYIDTWQSEVLKKDSKYRYITAMAVSYETVLSLYDFNTSSLFCCRFFKNADPCIESAENFIRSLKGRTNLEARIIGMQNGQDYSALDAIMKFLGKHKIPITELDIFGNERRNIAIDSYTGMVFNVLENNMLYKPGDLINNVTLEQFERSVKPAPSKTGHDKKALR
ncbi:MAG: hypothetical protein ACP5MX_00775 [Candidatus Micrarchaeia archaeon]